MPCQLAAAAHMSLLMTFTYILYQDVRMSRKHNMVGSIDRRGQENEIFAMLMGLTKRFKA